MIKCDCYCTEEQIIGWHTPVDPIIRVVSKCNGTRERDACSCGGDRAKCDFYPEVREKALKEQEPKFGEWISVKDRLPEKFKDVLCFFPKKDYGNMMAVDYMETEDGWFARQLKWGVPTHWMPLPEPPEN